MADWPPALQGSELAHRHYLTLLPSAAYCSAGADSGPA
jgi:hypothetical protein